MKIAVLIAFLVSVCIYTQATEKQFDEFQALLAGGKCDISAEMKETNKKCYGEENPSKELLISVFTDKEKGDAAEKCFRDAQGFSFCDIVTKENVTLTLDKTMSFSSEEGRDKVSKKALECLNDEQNQDLKKLNECLYPTLKEVCLV